MLRFTLSGTDTMVILKFGGTSVSTKFSLETIVEVVTKQLTTPVVVVSAVSGMTDLLTSLKQLSHKDQQTKLEKFYLTHKKLIYKVWSNKDARKVHCARVTESVNTIRVLLQSKTTAYCKLQDSIVAQGEILSSYMVACMLCDRGVNSTQVVSTQLICTDNHYGSAEYMYAATKRKIIHTLTPLRRQKIVPVITGYIGATVRGSTTTFGRGGSDYTATILGRCLQAEEIQIWTDVDGVYTADPRVVKDAHILPNISFEVADAFAQSGAKVLYAKSVEPAALGNIPIRVLNTFRPNATGTVISGKRNAFRLSKIIGISCLHMSNSFRVSFIGYNVASVSNKKHIQQILYDCDISKGLFRQTSAYCMTMDIKAMDDKRLLNSLHNSIID